jgi:type II secretory pathway pseudopilin PulG
LEEIIIIASKQTENMRIVINLILVLLTLGLIAILILSIYEPIQFRAEKNKRERAVIQKLMEIRTAQEAYRGVTGSFAPNFDTLQDVLTNGEFRIIQVFGDPDDPTNTEAILYDTIYKPAIDSIRTLEINLDSLPFVPYGKGAKFAIAADTLTYQKTLVNVVEVGTPRAVFMGKYAKRRYARYDNNYDPGSVIKFGDMNSPNTSGNWER